MSAAAVAPPALAEARAYVVGLAHPEANRYPMMSDERTYELAASIRAHGQHRRIVIDGDGRVVDGRNRWVACLIEGIEPAFEPWDGREGTIETFVEVENLHRRDLEAGQRAMIVAARPGLIAQSRAAARARMALALSGGDPAAAGTVGKVAQDAAAIAGVSSRTMEAALAVQAHGVPELVGRVIAGNVSVSVAADVARAAPAEQRQLVQALDEALAHPDPAVRKVSERVIRQKAKGLRERDSEQKRAKERQRLAEASKPDAATDAVEIRLGKVADVLPTLPAGWATYVTADPGWDYDNGGNGAAKRHYEVMDLDDVVLDLALAFDRAADDAYLVVWVTHPFEEAWYEAVYAAKEYRKQPGRVNEPLWRWKAATGGSWGKLNQAGEPMTGNGVHVRGASEPWKLYTKGRCKPFALLRNHYTSEPGEHSEKPLPYVTDMMRAFSPPGGNVLVLYAGRAPDARAALALRRPCVAIESHPERWAEGHALLRALPVLPR